MAATVEQLRKEWQYAARNNPPSRKATFRRYEAALAAENEAKDVEHLDS